MAREALGDRTKITDRGLPCPGFNCESRIGVATVRKLALLGSKILPDERAVSGNPPVPIIALSDGNVALVERFMEEAAIPPENQVYCPMKECMRMNNIAPPTGGTDDDGVEVNCVFCNAHFCSRCHDEWEGHGPDKSCRSAKLTRVGNTASMAYIEATSKPCPQCKFPTTHWHGHECHHMGYTTNGCPRCRCNWCYACLTTGAENTAERGRASRCKCPGGFWSAYCNRNDIVANIVSDPYPRDTRCGCQICPNCRPESPCETCNGDCAVCEGLIPPGPLELADNTNQVDSTLSSPYEEISGDIDIKCPSGHIMIQFPVGTKPPNYSDIPLCDADICRINRNSFREKYTPFYHCSTCNYDLCMPCISCREVVKLARHGTIDEQSNYVNQIQVLSKNDRNCKRIISAGGIDLLIALARDGTPNIKTKATVVLNYWTANSNANKVHIASKGGIEVFIALARDSALPDKTAVYSALFRLASNDDNKIRIATEGGIEVHVALARDGTKEDKTTALSTLDRLASNDDIKACIAAAGGIEVLVALSRDGTNEEKAQAVGLLEKLTCNDNNKV
ncbi:MAG: IBR domain-containing protein, partial [Candidatus Poseidoniales archaeon]